MIAAAATSIIFKQRIEYVVTAHAIDFEVFTNQAFAPESRMFQQI